MSATHGSSGAIWRVYAPPIAALVLFALEHRHIVDAETLWVAALSGVLLLGSVFAAVHHAEVVALKVGEPFGSVLLALAVTVIEASLIVTAMLLGRRDRKRARARFGVRGRGDRAQRRRRASACWSAARAIASRDSGSRAPARR